MISQSPVPLAAATGDSTNSALTPVTASGSGFVINVIYDSSANSAPAAFKSAIQSAVQYLESVITTPITVNIDVGYGEVGGQALDSGALGESETYLDSYSYSSIKSALANIDPSAASSLPASAPGAMWVATAEAKALGLAGASSNIDGYAGFSNVDPFTYDPNNRAVTGEYDFIGVVEHEFTEDLGRIDLFGANIGGTPNSYSLLDLYHYTSPGVHTYTGTTANYFSVDGGITNLDNFNTNPNGDSGDWAASAGNDSFLAFSSTSKADLVSQADITEMNALGYALQPDLTEYVAVSNTTVAAGGSTTVSAYAMNIGYAVSPGSTAGIYLSTDATITTSDTLLTTVTSPGLATVGQPGYYDLQNVSVTLAANLTPGTYYIGGIADYNNAVSESSETNNTYNTVAITVTAPAKPDLTEYVAVSNTTVAAGGSTTVSAYAMNIGYAVSPGSTAGIYLSTDATITTSDTLLTTVTSPGLATVSQPGYYDLQTVSVTLAANLTPGTYYIGGIADYNNAVSESSDTNNTYNTVAITVTAPAKPDLTEYVAVSNTTVAAGGSTTVSAYAMNIGYAVSPGSTAGIYLSTDATITTSDTLLTTVTSPGLATVSQPGYYDLQNVSVTLAANLTPGTYYIGGIADYNNAVSESNESNNTYNTVAITVTAPAKPDLTEYVAVSNTTVAAGGSTTVSAYAMNIGYAVSPGSTAGIYLSTDATITTSDTLLTTVTSPGLATVSQPGYYDLQNVSVTLAANLTPGTYYIGGIADYNNAVSESSDTNNTYNTVAITVTAPAKPDLTEYVAVSNTTVAAGGSTTVSAYAMNIGYAVSPGSTAGIYLSTDATITTSDTLLTTVTSPGLATVSQPGYYDLQNVSVTLAANLTPGTYYIGGIADYNNAVSESSYTNNTYNVVQITVTAAGAGGTAQAQAVIDQNASATTIAAGATSETAEASTQTVACTTGIVKPYDSARLRRHSRGNIEP